MPDYMYMLESRLSAEQRAAVVRIQELAAATESNLYLTGGAVRDLICGMPIRDLDFTVEGNPFRIARELEKGGAKILSENETLRYVELILSGDVDGSLAAARDEVYPRPGARPEIHFSTITQDLRRRDFSVNSIAISLNPQSRGLLLDPANGLADLERREIRALSIHSFTNQPVRLLRALRYATRLGFKMDARTAEWFHLALDRSLQETIQPEDAGYELRQLAREEKPAAILKAWDAHGLLGALHPQLAKRRPDYDALHRITRVRDEMWGVGIRPRLFAPLTLAVTRRLSSRERGAALARLELRAAEIHAVEELESEAAKTVKLLAGRKTASPRDAYAFLDKTRHDLLAYILAESSHSKAVSKIRNYLNKWRPLRQALSSVATELELLGLARGPKFDKVLEEFFQAQLLGKGRKPEEHPKLLRKLAGIKEPPKKPLKDEKEKKKPDKPKKKGAAAAAGAPGMNAVKSAGPIFAASRPAASPAAPPSLTAKARPEPPRGKAASGGQKPAPAAQKTPGKSKPRKR